MLFKLSNELLHKIFIYLDKYNIYNITLSSKIINQMNFHKLLLPLFIKDNLFGTDNIKLEILEYKNDCNYLLIDYLKDLDFVINLTHYNYENRPSKYIIKNMCKFNHNQNDLFEKKNIIPVKIHPTYRIPYTSYRILKMRKSPILALIY